VQVSNEPVRNGGSGELRLPAPVVATATDRRRECRPVGALHRSRRSHRSRAAALVVPVLLTSLSLGPESVRSAAAQPPTATEAVRVLQPPGVRAEAVALILSGQEGGSVPVQLLAVPTVVGTDATRVHVEVEIDGPALLDLERDPLRLELFVYALAEGNALRGSILRAFEIDPQLGGDRGDFLQLVGVRRGEEDRTW